MCKVCMLSVRLIGKVNNTKNTLEVQQIEKPTKPAVNKCCMRLWNVILVKEKIENHKE